MTHGYVNMFLLNHVSEKKVGERNIKHRASGHKPRWRVSSSGLLSLRFNVSYVWGLISGACVHNVR